MSKPSVLRRLLVLLKPYWPAMLGAGFLSAATVFANVGLIGTSAVLISWAALRPPILDLMMLIVAVRFFGISRAGLRYAERYINHDITLRILSKLRVLVYQAIEPLLPQGVGRFSQGQLFGRLTEDIETLQFFYLKAIAAPLTAGLVLVGSSLWLWQFSPPAAVVLAVTLIVGGVLIPYAIKQRSAQTAQQTARLRETLNSQLVDFIKGIGDLQGAAQAQAYRRRLLTTWQSFRQGRGQLTAWQSLTTDLITYLSHAALWLALVVSIPLAASGELNGIYLAMVVLVVWTSFEAVIPLPQTLIQLEQSKAAAGHVFELIDQAQKLPERAAKQAAWPEEHTLRLEAVDFAYDAGHPLFEQVSLTIPAGEQIAVVGASGSGKSTLADLLLGFWQPTGGAITIGGVPLTELSEETLRAHIGIVEQSAYLFNATLRENLLLAQPKASEEALWQALAQAQLAEFVRSLPAGLDTPLGEGGMKLSGGQRQRVALARLFLRDYDIIILDEATQGLDTLTAAELLQEIQRWSLNKTVITITHSLAELQDQQHIVVLDHGRVAEAGSKAQLLAQDGMFARMWAMEKARF